MKIEEEIFKKVELSFDQLLLYGFMKRKNVFFYSTQLIDGFRAEIEINESSVVTGKIFDLALAEEYTSFRIESYKGNFVNEIRMAYSSLLEDIVKHCGKKLYFCSSQGNRIAEYILREYQSNPEFLWEKYPDTGIFRHSFNRKWYALITTVEKKKLKKEFDGLVEILNVKIEPKDLEDYVKLPGVFPAYHMNKKSWISIVLDDTFKDEELITLVNRSRILTS